MAEVTIVFKVDNSPSKEKLNRELNWYDVIKKEMQVFYGGKLSLEYKEDEYLVSLGEEERKKRNIRSTYRLLPKVEDLEITNYNKTNSITNKKDVEKWFKDYLNYNNSDITIIVRNNDNIEFDVPNKEVNDFVYQIERKGFEYRT
jgi:hypothetical protein